LSLDSHFRGNDTASVVSILEIYSWDNRILSLSKRGVSCVLYLAIVIILIGIITGIYGFFEARRIKITRLELKFEKLPDAFDGFQFVHISDLHIRNFGSFEKQLLGKLKILNPKLILMTGDFKWSKYTDNQKVINAVQKILDEVKLEYGFICIKGNHDKLGFIDELRKLKLVYLHNEYYRLINGENEVYILGVSNSHPMKRNRGIKKLRKAKDNLKEEAFKILLAHTPDYMPFAKKERIDLVLAGDTHGGQVRLPLLGALAARTKTPLRYSIGLIKEGDTILYTNRGVGTRGIPIRLFCPPEIAVITLRKR